MRSALLMGLLIVSACMPALGRAENLHPSAAAWKKIASVDLPGPLGKRFDYLEVDEEEGLLLSAHLAADTLYLIDLATNRAALRGCRAGCHTRSKG